MLPFLYITVLRCSDFMAVQISKSDISAAQYLVVCVFEWVLIKNDLPFMPILIKNQTMFGVLFIEFKIKMLSLTQNLLNLLSNYKFSKLL